MKNEFHLFLLNLFWNIDNLFEELEPEFISFWHSVNSYTLSLLYIEVKDSSKAFIPSIRSLIMTDWGDFLFWCWHLDSCKYNHRNVFRVGNKDRTKLAAICYMKTNCLEIPSSFLKGVLPPFYEIITKKIPLYSAMLKNSLWWSTQFIVITAWSHCDDFPKALWWSGRIIAMNLCKGGNEGKKWWWKMWFSFWNRILRDSVVSGNHENRTICKPWMFIFIFLINNDKEGMSYEK